MNNYSQYRRIPMRKLWIVIFVLGLALIGGSGCDSGNDKENYDFTGKFELTIPLGYKTSRVHRFELTQDGNRIWGDYTKREYAIGMQYVTSYNITGNTSTPDVAELQLTLREYSPPQTSEPPSEMVLNVALGGHGETLHIVEWNLDIPRIQSS